MRAAKRIAQLNLLEAKFMAFDWANSFNKLRLYLPLSTKT